MLTIEDLHKRFGATQALRGASFRCEAGRVHALLGENGAGKSTLVGIVGGVLRADSGTLAIDGAPLALRSARHARRAGIGVAYQELALVRELSVAQNLFLAEEPRGRLGLLRGRALRAQALAVLERGGLGDLDPDAPVETLPLSTQQKLEIVRATEHGSRVCLLDEPTSALAAEDVEWFAAWLERLRDAGRIVLFISHRLPEIRRFCDEVTVLRQGRAEGTWPLAEITDDALITAMLGRPLEMVYPERSEARPEAETPLLRVRGAGERHGLSGVSLDVFPGEIVGIAGLQGQGQEALLRGLFGDRPLRAETVEVDGRRLRLSSPHSVSARGVGFVPENRRTEGLLLELPAERNLTVTVIPETSRLGVMQPAAEHRVAREVVDELRVTAQAPWAAVSRLSGGNQQKLVVGKWLAKGSRLLLLYDPTRGVDVGTKHDLYELLRRRTDEGAGVLWYSTDIDELVHVCDRVHVMRHGRLAATFAGEELEAAAVLSAMLSEQPGTERRHGAGPSRTRRARAGWSSVLARLSWRLRGSRPTAIVLALAVGLFVLEGLKAPGGFTPISVQSTVNDSLGIGIAAMGETLVLLMGGFDLSAGAIVSLLNVLLATHLHAGAASGVGWTLLAIAAGAAMGFVNGASVVWLRLQGIIVTLAAGFVWSGCALLVLAAPGGAVPLGFVSALTGMWGNELPLSALVLAFAVLAWLALVRSPLGPRLYAVGADRRAAIANGIHADRTIVVAYALSGAFYGVSATFLTAQTAGGDPALGSTLLLTFFAAAAVGGVRLGGGRGSAVGALIGGFVLQLIDEVLFEFGVASYYTYIFQSLVLVVAVAVTGWARSRRPGGGRGRPTPAPRRVTATGAMAGPVSPT